MCLQWSNYRKSAHNMKRSPRPKSTLASLVRAQPPQGTCPDTKGIAGVGPLPGTYATTTQGTLAWTVGECAVQKQVAIPAGTKKKETGRPKLHHPRPHQMPRIIGVKVVKFQPYAASLAHGKELQSRQRHHGQDKKGGRARLHQPRQKQLPSILGVEVGEVPAHT